MAVTKKEKPAAINNVDKFLLFVDWLVAPATFPLAPELGSKDGFPSSWLVIVGRVGLVWVTEVLLLPVVLAVDDLVDPSTGVILLVAPGVGVAVICQFP